MVLQVATQIKKEDILQALSKLDLPADNSNLGQFISQIVVDDGNVVFAIKAEENKISEYINFKDNAEEVILALDGVEKVKIALTSHIEETKRKNEKKEKLSIAGVNKVFVIASGKGGVGKSTIAFNLACQLAKEGLNVGLVDLDIYGPSLGKLSGIKVRPVISNGKAEPIEKFGVKMMSVSFLVDSPDQALAWRGPMVSKMLYQLLNLTKWSQDGRKNLDILIVDTPPGTGDVHLSLLEKYKIDGVLIVSTPHNLSIVDVKKSMNLFDKLEVDILGVVNNMSYYEVDGIQYKPFGDAISKDKDFKEYKLFEVEISEDISRSSEYSMPISEIANEFPKGLQEIVKQLIN